MDAHNLDCWCLRVCVCVRAACMCAGACVCMCFGDQDKHTLIYAYLEHKIKKLGEPVQWAHQSYFIMKASNMPNLLNSDNSYTNNILATTVLCTFLLGPVWNSMHHFTMHIVLLLC
jgi:hypothetical protein